jgi:hypothetical protein
MLRRRLRLPLIGIAGYTPSQGPAGPFVVPPDRVSAPLR